MVLPHSLITLLLDFQLQILDRITIAIKIGIIHLQFILHKLFDNLHISKMLRHLSLKLPVSLAPLLRQHLVPILSHRRQLFRGTQHRSDPMIDKHAPFLRETYFLVQFVME